MEVKVRPCIAKTKEQKYIEAFEVFEMWYYRKLLNFLD